MAFTLRTAACLFVTCCVGLAAEHFSHEAQPNGIGNNAPGLDHINGRTLSEIPDEELARAHDESSFHYVTRVSNTVHSATYQCSPTDNTLSLIESQIAKMAVHLGINPEFELGLFGKRLKCGYCSERAAAVTRILTGNGFNATVWGIQGHVISRVIIDGSTYYADADYGVGAYQADLPRQELKNIYLKSPMPFAADLVAGMIDNKTDDASYYSNEYLEHLRSIRRTLFLISDMVGYALVGLSIAILMVLFSPTVAKRHSRNPSSNQIA